MGTLTLDINSYLSIIIRSVVVYLFIVLAIRLFGKKELTQLSVIDLVFILLISNAVQNAMVGSYNSLDGGIVAAASLFIVNSILKFITYKFKNINRLIQGTPEILIQNGIVIKKNLSNERITMEELEASIREHGVKSIEEVDLAILEVDGNISILSNEYQRRTTKKRKQHRIFRKEQ